MTGSLVFFDTFARLYGYCAAESTSSSLFCGTVCDSLCSHGLLIRSVDLCSSKTMEGAALVDDRAGIMFDVELCIPWDAPEAIMDIHSVGVVPLGSVPDVVGLFGRRPNAAASRILQGRDSRSIRFLVPDSRGVERVVDHNFHDVTVVDMGVVPETKVSFMELSLLCEKWPLALFKHLTWHQQQLELMHKEAKKRFHQTRPSPCRYCGKVIRCDMYRHVAKFHLDLAQLWRCSVSWCTVWKGTPQDCMDHLREAHDVPWISKTANIEKYVPPWTVRREFWTDALRPEHSGISADIMLFSDLGMSLAHHYRIHRFGLPHVAFWAGLHGEALLSIACARQPCLKTLCRRRAHRQTLAHDLRDVPTSKSDRCG